MQIIASFNHSSYIEMTIVKLEEKGVDDLYAIPLESRQRETRLFDSIHYSDGHSLLNKGMFLAVIFSVIATSRGFTLEWGPIYWGLIGAGSGLVLGFLIDLFLVKIKERNQILADHHQPSEIILIINCRSKDEEWVTRTLWEHHALGIATVGKE
ncbi:hypothetical protein FZC83_00155 [Rossellomorea marisflavi]|uniref:Uncharacterized protein n=1 Tax=Rossellomorea marisflavi TaxID=189381 RepID=A0A5D4S1L9_9BACI|nr:hypothetical protein [Rossellomorea marisflavi]TYS56028.1 hypothetical protein FZC83_00155 [Rossellomorea marisflavi]